MRLNLNKPKKKLFKYKQVSFATILELSSLKKIFKVLDKRYFIINFTHFCQLFYNCQAINTQKKL